MILTTKVYLVLRWCSITFLLKTNSTLNNYTKLKLLCKWTDCKVYGKEGGGGSHKPPNFQYKMAQHYAVLVMMHAINFELSCLIVQQLRNIFYMSGK